MTIGPKNHEVARQQAVAQINAAFEVLRELPAKFDPQFGGGKLRAAIAGHLDKLATVRDAVRERAHADDATRAALLQQVRQAFADIGIALADELDRTLLPRGGVTIDANFKGTPA